MLRPLLTLTKYTKSSGYIFLFFGKPRDTFPEVNIESTSGNLSYFKRFTNLWNTENLAFRKEIHQIPAKIQLEYDPFPSKFHASPLENHVG